jgi:hypothetical protein
LQDIAQEYLVEQHDDNIENKAHFDFFSPIPFPNKDADTIIG